MIHIPTDNLAYPILIKLSNGGSGTGVIINLEETMYIATAKHVLFDRKSNSLHSEKCRIINYQKDYKELTPSIFELDLKNLNANSKIISHKTSDVSIIEFSSFDRKIGKATVKPNIKIIQIGKSGTVGIPKSQIMPVEDVIISSEIFVLGFPSSIGLQNMPQIDYDRPLIRKGIVAGINYQKQTIILDCGVYPGNSGGPVMLRQSKKVGIIENYFIGLVSQFIPFDPKRINPKIPNIGILNNSGYSVIVPTNPIVELIEKLEKNKTST